MDAQRALLDELMGAARNLTEEEKRGFKEICWDDKEACGPYMVRFCPHDLFVNTRSDLGPCPRLHDQKLRESFEKSPRHDMYVPNFEAELAQFCEKLVMDLDRKVRRGRERLLQEVEPPPPAPMSAEKSEMLSVLEEKIKKLLEQAETLGEAGKVDEAEALMRKEKIKKLLEQAETLGEAGKVDEAEALMRKVDMLNAEKTALIQKPLNDKVMLTQEKKMALCEICGSFLVANDAAERTQSHVTGKQHIGYGLVRDFISEYKDAKEKAKEEERLAREKEAEERRKQKEMENEVRSRRSNSGERDRYHERERDRYCYRERDSDRGRSRDWGGKGSRDYKHKNARHGRDWGRDRYCDRNGSIDAQCERGRGRSRSRSPVRHGHRRSSRSPLLPY